MIVRQVPVGNKFTIPGLPGEYVKVRDAVSGSVVKLAGRQTKRVNLDDKVVTFESEFTSQIICDTCEVEVSR